LGTLTVDGNLLKKMIIAGANALAKKRHEVDAMNVFPVPDGDTGINMSMTVIAAAREVEKLNTPNIQDVAKAASGGSLRGARGNSGVILSQLFRGFAKGLQGVDIANMEQLALSAVKATETAYKAVMKPKEGTILTIARALGERAVEYSGDDVEEMIAEAVDHATVVLSQTPQMLVELKNANVVDAGGFGLLVFIRGALESMNRPQEALQEIGKQTAAEEENSVLSAAAAASGEILFGYCTEFFINAKNIDENTESSLKSFLETMGDSIVAVADEDIVKIHVHTNHPGLVLEKALKLGPLSNMKIENMRQQHTTLINFSSHIKEEEKPEPEKPFKEAGFVAVSVGAGLKELFANLGADEVVEGGQSMNPSSEDIIRAVEKVNSNVVYVLPNNKNIILVSEQASKMYTDKKIVTLPTKSIPQGVTCLVSYAPANSVEENTQSMLDAMQSTHCGQITIAVRDTVTNGLTIKSGDFLGILDGQIVVAEQTISAAAEAMMDRLLVLGSDVVSIYYGAEANKDDAERLAEETRKKSPRTEVEILDGGQPTYYYIISAE
jgi:DAK2 domain fusion protein YloV